MIVIGAFGLCFGVALAQNFKVFVLIPSSVVAISIVLILEFAKGNYFVDALLACVEVIFALQFGYLAGLPIRCLFVKGPKAVRSRNAWLS
jgi:hypothetical protein